jgi:aspartate racemase
MSTQQKILGVVGGVGPSATVDFMDKVIRNTPATSDQDHIRMIVDHDPTIPDRTAYLLGEGTDPTASILAVCKRLEAYGADLIAIPCNTAHAFIEPIQRQLSIPIINMLFETAQYVENHHGGVKTIGLLATNGTLKSRIYHDLIEQPGRRVVVPDEAHQDLLMKAIYGVKAGSTEGTNLEGFRLVLAHILNAGAELVILGCTELPLLSASIDMNDESIPMLDPGEILARKCVKICMVVK